LITKYLTKIPFFRRRIAHDIKYNHFSSLGISIPVKNGFWAPIPQYDAYDSFSEIFIKNEYLDFLPDAEIKKVIDIGANYGYFSLWLQSMNPNIELEALMIEPCINCRDSIDRLMRDQKLKGVTQMLDGVIDDPKLGHSSFFDRPFMASSSFITLEEEEEGVRKVRIITEDDIISKLNPPYDLIKCDIEGSEWEFLSHYPKILSGTRHLILEWHSWHNGKGGFMQISDRLKELNYQIIKESPSDDATGKDGKVGLILAQNLSLS